MTHDPLCPADDLHYVYRCTCLIISAARRDERLRVTEDIVALYQRLDREERRTPYAPEVLMAIVEEVPEVGDYHSTPTRGTVSACRTTPQAVWMTYSQP